MLPAVMDTVVVLQNYIQDVPALLDSTYRRGRAHATILLQPQVLETGSTDVPGNSFEQWVEPERHGRNSWLTIER